MKIGFLTASLARVPLESLVPWAAAQGFEALELAAWPKGKGRQYTPCHIDADSFTREEAGRVKTLFQDHGMKISSLAFYENNLHPDKARREQFHAHLRRVIEAAALLEVGLVGTFIGGRPVNPATVIKEAGVLFREMTRFAGDRGVRLMIENCPMENWVKFGLPGNYAYSPELWEALFNEVPENLGLNFDPSHLYWLGIDYDRAARDFADRIFHVHAKDAEVLGDGKYRYGVLAQQLGDNPWHSGWWRYRMPGKGGIDWAAFIGTLQEIGYDDVVSIEHEDPEYEGSEEKVREGLIVGLEHLRASIPVPV